MESNPLVEALRLALPVLLQIQIGTKIDYDNANELVELLQFVSRNRVSDQCILNIVNALVLRGTDLSPEQARSIVWSMSSRSMLVKNLSCSKLVENAIKVLRSDIGDGEFETHCTTVQKMVGKYLDDSHEFEKFYDEALFNRYADTVVTKDLGFENACFLQRHLNNLGFVHIKLLKYMVREVEKYPALIAEGKPTLLLSFVTAMSQANYKPENWSKIEKIIVQSSWLTKNKRTTLPWVKLSSELLSLGVECRPVWDKIFSDDFLKIDLTIDKNTRLLRLLELYQHIKVLTDYNVDSKIREKYLVDAKRIMLNAVSDHPMKEYVGMSSG